MKQAAIAAMLLGLGLATVACERGGAGAVEPIAGQAAATDTLQLTWKAPAVGRRDTLIDSSDTRVRITESSGRTVDSHAIESKRIESEVLEVAAGGAITRVRVRYDQDDDRMSVGHLLVDNPSAVEGKTYLVSADAGSISATHEDGTPASDEAVAAIAEDVGGDLGAIPSIVELLLSRAWRTGEQVRLTAEELILAVEDPSETMTAHSGTLTLIGVAGGVATFELSLAAFMSSETGPLDTTLKGTLTLDVAHVRLTSFRMTGSFGGNLRGKDVAGTVSVNTTISYR